MITTSCAVNACQSPVAKRGWCNAHYIRWRRHGTPDGGGTDRRRRTSGTCSAVDCSRPHLALGWCQLHYRQQYDTGAVTRSDGSETTARGQCSQPECTRPASVRGGLCAPHQHRSRRGTALTPPVGEVPSRPLTVIHAVHRAVARQRGPAREWHCAACSLPAAEWAFCGVERADFWHPRLGYFSTDVDDYMPLCVSCHRAKDAAARQIRRHGYAGCAKCSGPHYCRGLCKVHYNQTVWAERKEKTRA